MKSLLEWDQVKFYKVRSKKRSEEKKIQALREAKFSKWHLKMKEQKFCLESFDPFMLLSC